MDMMQPGSKLLASKLGGGTDTGTIASALDGL